MKREKDYYQILGVSPKATSTEIRRAYHWLATLNLQEKDPSAQALLRMQEFSEAYGVLGDKRKRAEYDSERSNFTAVPQTTSAPDKTTAPLDLQQIRAEDVAPRIGWRSVVTIAAALMPSIAFFVWSLAELNWETASYAFFILVLSSISVVGIFFLWMSHKFSEIEAQCPRCGKGGAAQKMSERLAGVFQKREFITPYINNKSEDVFTTYERYNIHYRCKYCLYEWQFIKTRQPGIL